MFLLGFISSHMVYCDARSLFLSGFYLASLERIIRVPGYHDINAFKILKCERTHYIEVQKTSNWINIQPCSLPQGALLLQDGV